MDTNKILRALESAHCLINDEYQCLCDEDLERLYQEVMDEIENAIVEINGKYSDN